MQRMSTAEMPNAVRGLYIRIHVCLFVCKCVYNRRSWLYLEETALN